MISRPAFEYVRDLVAGRAGYRFDDGTEFLVESRLLPLARERSGGSVNELLRQAKNGLVDGIEQLLLETLVDLETAFFRDFWPFEALRCQILPELKSKRAGERQLLIWSVGCSTGQEPYSVALLIHEHFPDLLPWDIRIIGCDLSTSALHSANTARYNQIEVNRGLPVSLLIKHLQRDGPHWRLKPEVSGLVEFAPMNLLDPETWPAVQGADIVLLRNVIGKFSPEARLDLLRELVCRMKSDAFLFLGAKEVIPGIEKDFDTVKFDKATCFRPNASAVAIQKASVAAGATQVIQPAHNWSRLIKLSTRPGPLDMKEVRKILAADELLQKRVLTPSHQSSQAIRSQPKNLEEAIPSLTKERLLAAAFSEPASVAVNETFAAMLPSGLEAVPPESIAAEWSGQMVMSFRFVGLASGMINIRFISDFAKTLAAPVLDLSPEEVEAEMAHQMLVQACSLVSGRFQALLAEAGLECKIEENTVTQVTKFTLQIPNQTAHQPLAFRAQAQPILVDLVAGAGGQRSKSA